MLQVHSYIPSYGYNNLITCHLVSIFIILQKCSMGAWKECIIPCVCVCVCVCVCARARAKSLYLCPTLCNPMDYSLPGSSVYQEYWSGLPYPPPGDLPDPGIKPASLRSPALIGRFLTTGPPGKPFLSIGFINMFRPNLLFMKVRFYCDMHSLVWGPFYVSQEYQNISPWW